MCIRGPCVEKYHTSNPARISCFELIRVCHLEHKVEKFGDDPHLGVEEVLEEVEVRNGIIL